MYHTRQISQPTVIKISLHQSIVLASGSPGSGYRVSSELHGEIELLVTSTLLHAQPSAHMGPKSPR